MLKEVMFRDIDGIRNEMTAMADDIFDHPEIGLEEFHAQKVLTDWLEKEGFVVERGVAGVETALRLSTVTVKADRISDCSVSMTLFRESDMPADIICRDHRSWLPLRR